ncbi:MAG: DUF1003 domain-containing protein [Solirubrobacteraceae bacterium]
MSAVSSHRFVHHGTFGNDRFGILAERFARFFGTPRFIVGQTFLVVVWIAANAAAFSFQWDPYPFILLNLAFSTQAAYAAPLILLAQTRQAERDKLRDATTRAHHDAETEREKEFEARQTDVLKRERALAEQHLVLLAQNTKLTEEIARLTTELHTTICSQTPAGELPAHPPQ